MSDSLTAEIENHYGENCVVVFAPYGQDAPLIARTLQSAEIEAQGVGSIGEFVRCLLDCGVGLLTIEALDRNALAGLQATLERQPPWSDVPIVLLTADIDAATYAHLAGTLGNVIILKRPLEAASLLTVVRTALRAREKQRQVRDLLAAGEKRQAEIEGLNARLRHAMQETHHRVKNNLQVIAAMIELQAQEYKAANAVPLAEYRQLKLHVQTLAIVHDLLTRNIKEEEDAQRVSIAAVLDQLLPMLQQTAWQQKVHFSIADVDLTTRQSIALSLIATELVTNALKHGHKEAAVRLYTQGSEAILEVCDDGDGFPDGFSPTLAANMGLELVESLVMTDLGGVSGYENRPEGGGRVRVTFPLPAPME